MSSGFTFRPIHLPTFTAAYVKSFGIGLVLREADDMGVGGKPIPTVFQTERAGHAEA